MQSPPARPSAQPVVEKILEKIYDREKAETWVEAKGIL